MFLVYRVLPTVILHTAVTSDESQIKKYEIALFLFLSTSRVPGIDLTHYAFVSTGWHETSRNFNAEGHLERKILREYVLLGSFSLRLPRPSI